MEAHNILLLICWPWAWEAAKVTRFLCFLLCFDYWEVARLGLIVQHRVMHFVGEGRRWCLKQRVLLLHPNQC